MNAQTTPEVARSDEAHGSEDETAVPLETAAQQRRRVARPNRDIALLLLGGALAFLFSAFGVALLVSYVSF